MKYISKIESFQFIHDDLIRRDRHSNTGMTTGSKRFCKLARDPVQIGSLQTDVREVR